MIQVQKRQGKEGFDCCQYGNKTLQRAALLAPWSLRITYKYNEKSFLKKSKKKKKTQKAVVVICEAFVSSAVH